MRRPYHGHRFFSARRRFLTMLLSASLVLVCARVASAQDVPYDNYLVGDRALGLGGAFVGLADDASATFHNPAGLPLLPETSVSTSFWLVAYNRRDIAGGWLTGEGTSDLRESELTSPPLVVTAVARLGKPDARGLRRHAVGMAVLKPLRQQVRFAAVTGALPASLSALDVAHRDNGRWYGLSYAYGTRRTLRFGVSVFLARRSLVHEEIEIHGQNGPAAPSPDYAITRHSVLDVSLNHLIGRFGLSWTPHPRWRLGLLVQPPGTLIRGSAQNREVTYDIDAGGGGLITHVEHRDMHPRRPIPWELRLGAAWFPGARSLLTADVAVHGRAGSAADPVALIDQPDMPPPRYMPLTAHMGASLRAALGAEVVIGRRVPVRGGAFFYSSGVPAVPARADVPSPTRMSTLGASLSVGVLMAGDHELAFGASYTRGRGTASALDQSGALPVGYVAAEASEVAVLFFISGGKRAAKRFAKKLAKESGQWIEKGEDLLKQGGDWLRR